MPFIDKLEQQGFYVTPNRLFQSLTAVGAKSVRFKQVADDFWDKTNIAPAWGRTQNSWHHSLKWLEAYGVVTNVCSNAFLMRAEARRSNGCCRRFGMGDTADRRHPLWMRILERSTAPAGHLRR